MPGEQVRVGPGLSPLVFIIPLSIPFPTVLSASTIRLGSLLRNASSILSSGVSGNRAPSRC